jgi:hypothetical protein
MIQGKRDKADVTISAKEEQQIKENLFKAFKWDIIREKRRKMLYILNKLQNKSNRAKLMI